MNAPRIIRKQWKTSNHVPLNHPWLLPHLKWWPSYALPYSKQLLLKSTIWTWNEGERSRLQFRAADPGASTCQGGDEGTPRELSRGRKASLPAVGDARELCLRLRGHPEEDVQAGVAGWVVGWGLPGEDARHGMTPSWAAVESSQMTDQVGGWGVGWVVKASDIQDTFFF